jgi:hypothetical protein
LDEVVGNAEERWLRTLLGTFTQEKSVLLWNRYYYGIPFMGNDELDGIIME